MRELRGFLEQGLKRGSLERGVSLVEAVLAFAFVGAFILGGLYLFGQGSHNTRINEMGTHLAYAIEAVRGANPTGWFKDTSATRWSRYIPAGGETPHGKIRVALESGDPGDAFRLRYEKIPAAAIEEMCEPLLQRLLKDPHIDAGQCTTSTGASEMELRVRREETPLITIPFQYAAIPNCDNACNPANWRGSMPTPQEMRVIKDTLEALSFIHSRSASCNTGTWSGFYRCASVGRDADSVPHGHIFSPSGERYTMGVLYHHLPENIEQDIRDRRTRRTGLTHYDPDQTEQYPVAVGLRIDSNVARILRKYDSLVNNNNRLEGYKGMFEMASCAPAPHQNECYASAYINPLFSTASGYTPWWYDEDDN